MLLLVTPVDQLLSLSVYMPRAHPLQSLIVPACFVAAWALISLMIWSGWTNLKQGMNQVVRLHQIPCAGCQYFTGEYTLKCTVHPKIALTETAIGCPDFQAATDSWLTLSTHSGQPSQSPGELKF